jgi:hypothetical protein
MSFLSKKARQYVPATLLVYSIVTHGQDSGNEIRGFDEHLTFYDFLASLARCTSRHGCVFMVRPTKTDWGCLNITYGTYICQLP